jgi:hypothetical protein
MPERTVKADLLIGGISTQPSHIRFPNQQGDSTRNVRYDVRDGAHWRPGTQYITTVSSLTALGDYRLHAIERDELEQYVVVYGQASGAMDVRVFDALDGSEATVNVTAAAQTYLSNGTPDASDMRALSFIDSTFFLNTTVTAASSTSEENYTITETWEDYVVMISHWVEGETYHYAQNDVDLTPAGYWQYLLEDDENGFARWTKPLQENWLGPRGRWDEDETNPMGVRMRFQRYDFDPDVSGCTLEPIDLEFEISSPSAAFDVDETVSGSVSGATATMRYENGTDRMYVEVLAGTFTGTDTLTGGSSGSTASVEDISAVNFSRIRNATGTPFATYAAFAEEQIDHVKLSGFAAGADDGYYEVQAAGDNDLVIANDTGGDGGLTGSDTGITAELIEQHGDVSVNFNTSPAATMNDIAKRLQASIQANGHNMRNALIAYTETGPGTAQMEVVSPFRGTNATILGFEANPNGDFNLAGVSGGSERPFLFEGAGDVLTDGSGTQSPSADDDTVAVEDRWDPVAAPGQSDATIDADRFPVEMVRTTVSPLVFDISQITIPPRTSGDEASNPVPSIWAKGEKITDMVVHRNRFGVCGGPYMVFGQAGDFFNFFVEDADNIADSDPIDIELGGSGVSLTNFMIPFRKGLVITTKGGQQFELTAPEALTPSTAALEPSTSIRTVEAVRPTVIANELYLPREAACDESEIYEYRYDDAIVTQRAESVSNHVQGLIPGSLRTMVSHESTQQLFVLSSDNDSEHKLYVFATNGPVDQRVMQAWSVYEFDETYRIVDIAVVGEYLWLLIESASQFILERMPIRCRTESCAGTFTTTTTSTGTGSTTSSGISGVTTTAATFSATTFSATTTTPATTTLATTTDAYNTGYVTGTTFDGFSGSQY